MYADELPHRFVAANDGRRYAAHFWMYSLVAYPAKLALRAVDGREFNALVVTNAVMFALGVGALLFLGQGAPAQRFALALLMVVTPVAWYVTFTGVEVFCWALVVVALALPRPPRLRGQRRWRRPWRPRRILRWPCWRPCRSCWPCGSGCGAAPCWPRSAAALPSGPIGYYGLQSGVPGPMTRTNSDLGLISWSRTASLLFDLNAGLPPYVPVLLAAALWASVRAGARDAMLPAALWPRWRSPA